MFPGTQPYAMTSKKNCDSDAQGCAQLNGNHEVIAKPSRLFSPLNTLKPLRGTQKTQNPSPLPLYSPLSRFLQGNQGSSKNRDKDASMLFNVRGPYRPPPALRTGMQILTGK